MDETKPLQARHEAHLRIRTHAERIFIDRHFVCLVGRPLGLPGAVQTRIELVSAAIFDREPGHAQHHDLAGTLHDVELQPIRNCDGDGVHVSIASEAVVLAELHEAPEGDAVLLARERRVQQRPRATLVATSKEDEGVEAHRARAWREPDIQDSADAYRSAVPFAADAPGAFCVYAAKAVETFVVVVIAADARDSELDAAIEAVAAKTSAVAPDRVLVVVVRPCERPIVTFGCEPAMRVHVERHACDDR